MNTIPATQRVYLLVFEQGKLIVVRNSIKDKWRLPSVLIGCEMDRPRAQITLARYFDRVTVCDDGSYLPDKEWETAAKFFPDARLYACSVEPYPKRSNETLVWMIGKSDSMCFIEEEVQAVLSLPCIRNRLV